MESKGEVIGRTLAGLLEKLHDLNDILDLVEKLVMELDSSTYLQAKEYFDSETLLRLLEEILGKAQNIKYKLEECEFSAFDVI